MTKIPSLLEMLKAGVHFGHQRSRWHPKMQPYIFGLRNGVHIIDLEKTAIALGQALEYVKNLVADGKVILFVGTKRQARDFVTKAAESCGMPYVTERWIGGLLTNFEEFKRRMKKYKELEGMTISGEIEKYTKKEQAVMQKQLLKMDKYLKGLKGLEKLPDALYIADLRVEKTAVTEAGKTAVPMVAVCDTNTNPDKAAYPIPSNDDAVHAIEMMVNAVAAAVNEGKVELEKRRLAEPVAAAAPAKLKLTFTDESEALAPAMAKSVSPGAAPGKERRVIKTQEVV